MVRRILLVCFVGKIKGLITDKQLNINHKGIDLYPIDSYHRFIITTNELEPITTGKDDRRNLVIRSSDELIGNKQYFDKIHKLLEDINVIKTCYEYFKNLPDLDKFGQVPKPITEYQRNLQELSVSPIELWVKDLAYTHEKDFEMFGSQAYESFVEFCEKHGFIYEANSLKLGVRLSNLGIKGIYKGQHTMYGRTKLYKVKELRMYFSGQKTMDEYLLN
ncbi:MAG: hypothetical protein H7339_11290 [Arcicella sp.]|nr:hypothetical protein [Arcicella sp.]